MMESASWKLSQELRKAGAPPHIYERARDDYYHSHNSPLTFPRIALLDDLRSAGMHEFARRVLAGEFEMRRGIHVA